MDMKIFCQDVSVVIRSIGKCLFRLCHGGRTVKKWQLEFGKTHTTISEGRVDAFGGFAPATETY
jgi:hypothetical protein